MEATLLFHSETGQEEFYSCADFKVVNRGGTSIGTQTGMQMQSKVCGTIIIVLEVDTISI